MPLHITYRPDTLDKLYGNQSIKDSLASLFSREKDIPFAYLLIGPSGCGKTTIARIIATMLKCSPSAVQEYNSSNTRGIDTIREIDDQSRYAPFEGDKKVYIIDECHKLTNDAQNAILKLLEDPTPGVYFILGTTEPEKLLKTILTRCTTYQVKPLNIIDMNNLLKYVLKEEKVADFYPSVLSEIIKMADGCPRQALVMLDSVIDIFDEERAMSAVMAYVPLDVQIRDLVNLLLDMRTEKWPELAKKLKAFNEDPEQARYAILTYFSKVLLDKENPRIPEMMEFFRQSFMYTKKAGLVQAVYFASKI